MKSAAPAEVVRAAELLERVLFDGAWLDPLLRAQRRRKAPEPVRRRSEFWCRTVLERERGMRQMLQNLLDRPGQKMQPRIEALLLLGMSRLLFSDAPEFAVVNETVAALPKRHYGRGFVNAVLRRAADRREALRQEFQALPADLRWSVPEFWLTELSRAAPNETSVDQILASLRHSPGLHIVADEAAREALEARGVTIEPVAGGAGWRVVRGQAAFWAAVESARLPGVLQIQDGGIASWLDVVRQNAPGPRVWDAFCAPGGKLLGLARDGFDVLGTDRSAQRLKLVRTALQQAGLHAELRPLDLDEQLVDESFDLVLADVPCSASGTLGRHPEVARRSDRETLERLQSQQRHWLSRVAQRVRPGGVLWYSTCSLFPAENEDVVDAFLAEQPAFTRRAMPHPISGEPSEVVRLWPHLHGVAGFSAQALVRAST